MGSNDIAFPSTGRRLEGKVALITGGATGIGKATAKIFCLHGARVVIADVQDDLGKSVCAAVGSKDVVTFIHCDVSKEEDVKNAVDFAVATYGKLDIMFNNAGIVERPCSRIMDFNVSEFERTMSINCTGVFIGIKHAARVMVAAGLFIFFTFTQAKLSAPDNLGLFLLPKSTFLVFIEFSSRGEVIVKICYTCYGQPIAAICSVSWPPKSQDRPWCSVIGGLGPHGYVASKHAVVGLTKNGAAELGQYGIRVNCISPYLCASSLVKMFSGMKEQSLEEWGCDVGNLKGAILATEDIACAALFLGSDESKYVSGHNFVVDGGVTTVNNSFGLFNQEA